MDQASACRRARTAPACDARKLEASARGSEGTVHQLARRLETLSRMTVKNGCTAPEAAAAQAKLSDLMKRHRLDDGHGLKFTSCDLERAIKKAEQREKSRQYRMEKRAHEFAAAHGPLVSELRRRNPHLKIGEARRIVREAVAKLLDAEHPQSHRTTFDEAC